MQSDRDLLRQALETLDAIAVHGDVACVVAPEKEFWLQPIITALRERLAQPEQEPVACVCGGWRYCPICGGTGNTNLYSTPLRREWQGLTEEEIKAMPQWFPSHETAAVMPLIRAIEAKLKEKNA